jgi:hypothetical protein
MLAALGTGILVVFALSIIIAGLFMWAGAKMAGIQNATLGKSIGAAIAVSLVTWIIAVVFSILPVIGTFIGFIVGLIIALFVIKSIFNTTMGKAFLAWIFNIFAQILAIVLSIALGVGALGKIFKI